MVEELFVGIDKVIPYGTSLVLVTRVLDYDEQKWFPIEYNQGSFNQMVNTPYEYYSMLIPCFPDMREWIKSGSYKDYMGEERKQIKIFPIKTDGYVE